MAKKYSGFTPKTGFVNADQIVGLNSETSDDALKNVIWEYQILRNQISSYVLTQVPDHTYDENYWVDTVNGLNTNDGSENIPFETIEYAYGQRLANFPNSNCTIYVKGTTHIPTINLDGTGQLDVDNRSTYIIFDAASTGGGVTSGTITLTNAGIIYFGGLTLFGAINFQSDQWDSIVNFKGGISQTISGVNITGTPTKVNGIELDSSRGTIGAFTGDTSNTFLRAQNGSSIEANEDVNIEELTFYNSVIRISLSRDLNTSGNCRLLNGSELSLRGDNDVNITGTFGLEGSRISTGSNVTFNKEPTTNQFQYLDSHFLKFDNTGTTLAATTVDGAIKELLGSVTETIYFSKSGVISDGDILDKPGGIPVPTLNHTLRAPYLLTTNEVYIDFDVTSFTSTGDVRIHIKASSGSVTDVYADFNVIAASPLRGAVPYTSTDTEMVINKNVGFYSEVEILSGTYVIENILVGVVTKEN